jgi:putative selenium metabolism hydrolase
MNRGASSRLDLACLRVDNSQPAASTECNLNGRNGNQNMKHQAVGSRARKYQSKMVKLLRELVAIPGESAGEGPVVARIKRELKQAGVFDRVWTDPFGNLFAKIGRGRREIAIDAHVDTVGIGDRAEWKHDPYKGKVANGIVYGRGAGDQRGAVPAMIYGARILKEMDLLDPSLSLVLAFTVSEEDCDGLNWQYIVKETGFRPECVVVTDSTNCRILRGQRGRMEMGVTVKGRSCHGSMPHKGDNAIYKIARVVGEIEKLNGKLKDDAFLGKGTITVSYVDCSTPSMCAVPDRAYIHLDRRLTAGESKTLALRQVRDAVRRAGVKAAVAIPTYERPTYTGLVYPTPSYFPTWCEPEDARQVRAAVQTYKDVFGRSTKVGRWTFSTNAVSIAGMFGIPCVGFGPAPEAVAHTVNDSVPIDHMVKCAAFYAAFPSTYLAVSADERR